jgi:phenylglyoxylate dehydrogenase alpha subunit
MAIDPLTGGAGGPGPSLFVRYRKGQCAGMQNALAAIEAAHEDWARIVGRRHAPLVESYRMDDAESRAGHPRLHDRRRQGRGR